MTDPIDQLRAENEALSKRVAELEKRDETPRTDDLRYLDWAITWLHAQLSVIVKTARDARSRHSVQGHHCELRSAIDSICDREPGLLEHIRIVSKHFQTRQILELKEMEQQLAALRTEAVAALEKAATLNTGQDCPSENMAVVVAAMNALTALRGDNAGGER